MAAKADSDVQDYLRQSQHYLLNARELIVKGENTKATELIWGSVAEAVKAVAASRGRELRSHGAIRDYVRASANQLRASANQLQDRDMVALFNSVEGAHRNFYEEFMKVADVREVLAKAMKLLEKLHRLVGV